MSIVQVSPKPGKSSGWSVVSPEHGRRTMVYRLSQMLAVKVPGLFQKPVSRLRPAMLSGCQGSPVS